MQVRYMPSREKSVTTLMYIGDAELDRVTNGDSSKIAVAVVGLAVALLLLGGKR
jgi:hypothetical protein